MAQMFIWMFGMSIAISAMVVAAAMEARGLHLALGLVISAFIAAAAIMAHRNASVEGIDQGRRAALLSRYMGMQWAWAAVTVLVTYGLILVQAEYWPVIVLILALGGGMCLFVANILERDAASGAPDPRLVRFVGQIAKVQFATACLALGGLVMSGSLSLATHDQRWAAVNLLICASIGLAGLCGYALTQFGGIASKTKVASNAVEAPTTRARRPMARAV